MVCSGQQGSKKYFSPGLAASQRSSSAESSSAVKEEVTSPSPRAPAEFLHQSMKEAGKGEGIRKMKCQGIWEFLANMAVLTWFQKRSLDKCSNYVKWKSFWIFLNSIKRVTVSMIPRDRGLCFICCGFAVTAPHTRLQFTPTDKTLFWVSQALSGPLR